MMLKQGIPKVLTDKGIENVEFYGLIHYCPLKMDGVKN